jgi:hypothetical protein
LSDVTTRQRESTTRRQIMRAGLAAIGGVAAVSAQAQAQADAKIAQAQVQYQLMPKDGAKCSTCVNFEAPASCKIVAGTISPNGWCIAYGPKDPPK